MMTTAGLRQLMAEEGFRNYVYDDKSGHIILKGSSGGNPIIGYGRNLATRGISAAEGCYLLQNDINAMWASLTRSFPWVQQIDPVLQDVIMMIEYNTGDVGAFTKFLAALKNGDCETASAEILNSRAAHELPARYSRISQAILNKRW